MNLYKEAFMTRDIRRLKGEAMRQLILDAAYGLIAAEGLYALSAKKIADDIGVSKSNIFHHFASVEHIKELVLDQLIDTFLTWSPHKHVCESNALPFFIGLFEEMTQLTPEDRKAYNVLLQYHTACLHEPIYLEKFIAAKKRAVTALFDTLRSSTDAPSHVIENIANTIVMTLDGFGLHYLLNTDDKGITHAWRHLCGIWYTELFDKKEV